MRTFQNLKDSALSALRPEWSNAVITYLVALLISLAGAGAFSFLPLFSLGDDGGSLLSCIYSILLIPMGWGLSVLYLRIFRQKGDRSVGVLFEGYRDFARILLTDLLKSVYVMLWSLLLFVPGIIKLISYSMTDFVLADRPDLKYNGAIERSMALMRGNKWRFFVFYLSFMGWALLCLLTFGIGFLWLTPYYCTSKAAFYEDLLAEELTGEEGEVETVINDPGGEFPLV